MVYLKGRRKLRLLCIAMQMIRGGPIRGATWAAICVSLADRYEINEKWPQLPRSADGSLRDEGLSGSRS